MATTGITPEEELRETLRALLLPVSPAHEHAAIAAANAELEGLDVAEVDRAEWVRVRARAWRDEAERSEEFADVVWVAIEAGDPALGRKLADAYFPMHDVLIDSFLMTHDEASAFLS